MNCCLSSIVTCGMLLLRSACQAADGNVVTLDPDDWILLPACDALDRQFEARGLVYHGSAAERHLAGIAATVVPEPPLENVKWQFLIARDPLVNAFALPNGSVYINTGILAVLENDDQLAGVLAHEIAHVVHRHSYLAMREYRDKLTRMMYTRLALAPTMFLPYGIGLGAAVISSINRPMAEASLFGYSAVWEREADRFAVDRLTRSGRDPGQILRSFERMAERLDADARPTFYAQGAPERRTYLEAAVRNKPATPLPDAAYLATMRDLIGQNIRLDLISRRFRSAVRGAQRLIAAHPDDAQSLYLAGEAYRRLGPRTEAPAPAEVTDGRLSKADKQELDTTETEAFQTLAATREGASALQANHARAERLFQRAVSTGQKMAAPHLGLGLLYEQQNRGEQARAEYQMYLELAPDAADKVRVQRRLEALGGK